MIVSDVDNLLFVSGSWSKRLHTGFDFEDGATGLGLELAEEA